MRKACFLFLFLFTASFASATDLPQPQGWVNDFANVISQDYRDKLNSLIQELEEKTSSEIAVVTIDSISPYGEIEYARLLFDNWKPGKKGKDNGILVLLAIKERRWRIETGYGVEGILPDGLCGEIGRNYMVPYFKQGKYSEGLFYGVTEISRILGGGAAPTQAEPQGHNSHGVSVFYYVIILFPLLLILITFLHSWSEEGWRYEGCGWGGGGFGGGGGGFGGGGGGGGGAGGGF